jgi:PAS domain S-box-containing protein
LSFLHPPVGILFAQNREICDANLRLAEMFGWPRERLIGQSLAGLYPSIVEFDRIGDKLTDLLRVSGHYADERIMKRRNGDLFWCRVEAARYSPRHRSATRSGHFFCIRNGS